MNTHAAALFGAVLLHAAAFLLPGSFQPPSAVMTQGHGGEVVVELVASSLVEPPAAAVEEPSRSPSAAPAIFEPPPFSGPDLASLMPEPEEPSDVNPPEPFPEPALPRPKPVISQPPPARPAAAPAKTAIEGSSSAPGSRSLQAAPDYLRNPPPVYPAQSRKSGEQGTVLLKVSVSATGRPDSVEISKGSGYPRLDEAALNAVRRWKFKPAQIGGRRVAAQVEVPIRFNLE